MSLFETIATLGHIASRKQLATLGFRRHTVDQALRNGTLLPVRPGWVATRAASQLAVIAVLQGARLTGPTALRTHGVWAGSDRRTHLQLPANAHRVVQQPLTPIDWFTPPKFFAPGLVMHWSPCAVQAAEHPSWRVSVPDALVSFARRESTEQIVAAVESAVHEGRMSRTEVPGLFQRLPRRLRRLRNRLTFLAGSGLETIGRLRLEDLGYAVAQQVRIGRDQVDLVIDGWLIIELDGDEWHDPIKDRIRTNRLIRAGYRVLRFGYFEVFEQWANTLATIRVSLGEHESVVVPG